MTEPARRLAMLEQMIAKGSDDPFVHYARALELRALGRPADALAALEAVAERFPDYVATYLIAGQVAQELGRADRARNLLQTGIAAADRARNAHAASELRTLLATLE